MPGGWWGPNRREAGLPLCRPTPLLITMETKLVPSRVPTYWGPEAATEGGAGVEQTERPVWKAEVGGECLCHPPRNPQGTEGLRLVGDVSGIWIPALLAAGCVTVEGTLPFWKPQVPHLSIKGVTRRKASWRKLWDEEAMKYCECKIFSVGGERSLHTVYWKNGTLQSWPVWSPFYLLEKQTLSLCLTKKSWGRNTHTSVCCLWNCT